MKRLTVCLLLAACSRGAPAKAPVPAPAVAAAPPPPVTEIVRDANSAYDRKDFATCATLFGNAADRSEGAAIGGHAYNAACCAALAGDLDGAFRMLDRAVAAGFRDLAQLERDGDLAAARADARWADLRTRVEAAREQALAGVNRELLAIYEADQGDRQPPIDWSQVHPRDLERQERVKAIVAAGEARVAADYYHAAMVLQHGDHPEDYAQAHAWALRAVELDPEHAQAKWLAAASKDRHLMSLGKPQLYGTQYHRVDGKMVLYEVDPSVTDEERAKWNVPPLAEARKREAEINRMMSAPAPAPR